MHSPPLITVAVAAPISEAECAVAKPLVRQAGAFGPSVVTRLVNLVALNGAVAGMGAPELHDLDLKLLLVFHEDPQLVLVRVNHLRSVLRALFDLGREQVELVVQRLVLAVQLRDLRLECLVFGRQLLHLVAQNRALVAQEGSNRDNVVRHPKAGGGRVLCELSL